MNNSDNHVNYCNFDQTANPYRMIGPDIRKFVNYNPNSNHKLGREAKLKVQETIVKFKNIFKQYDVIEFVPNGGTMANKRAIFGSLPYHPKKINKDIIKNTIIISSIEHKSINEIITKELLNRGYNIIILPVSNEGIIIDNIFIETIEKNKNEVALVSIMNINNETGVIQNIGKLYKIIKDINKDIIFHSDICQGVDDLYYQQEYFPDIVSFSMYKLGGPHLGIVLSKYELNEDYYGTEDVESIQESGFIINEYLSNLNNDALLNIKYGIKNGINEISNKLGMTIKDISGIDSTSHIQSYLLPVGYEAKIIQNKLSELNVFIGSGSACSSQSNKGSHVIKALGYETQSFNLLRFSYDSNITTNQIDYMVTSLHNILCDLKNIVLVNNETNENNQLIDEKKNKNRNENKGKKVILNTTNLNQHKEYSRIDLPLDLDSEKPIFNSVKLSVGELYLKGNNKKTYEKKLVKCY